MNRAAFILALALSACTPGHVNSAGAAHACDTAITAAATAQDVAAIFVARGIEGDAAAKIAHAIATFQLSAAAACALLPPAPPA